jgi:hypothetical protein
MQWNAKDPKVIQEISIHIINRVIIWHDCY